MMIQVGDMVKLLSDDCSCRDCELARQAHRQVVSVGLDQVQVQLPEKVLEFPRHWEFDIQATVQENE